MNPFMECIRLDSSKSWTQSGRTMRQWGKVYGGNAKKREQQKGKTKKIRLRPVVSGLWHYGGNAWSTEGVLRHLINRLYYEKKMEKK